LFKKTFGVPIPDAVLAAEQAVAGIDVPSASEDE
jgi:hypothetical protein